MQHSEKRRKNPGRRKYSCRDSFTIVNNSKVNLGASKATHCEGDMSSAANCNYIRDSAAE